MVNTAVSKAVDQNAYKTADTESKTVGQNASNVADAEPKTVDQNAYKIVRTELVDETKLFQLLDSPSLDEKIKKVLESYVRYNRLTAGKYQVTYKHSPKYGKGMGRVFGGGLQRLQKDARAFIAGELYWDIDMVNCQPTILKHLCDTFDVVCDQLNEYVVYREAVLARYKITKDHAIAIFNDASRKVKIPFFKSIWDAIFKELVPKMREHELYEDLWTKTADMENREGKFISVAAQTFEHQILTKVVEFLEGQGFHCDVWIFDGTMVRREKGKKITRELLDSCEEYVQKSLQIPAKFIVKPMIPAKEFIKRNKLDEPVRLATLVRMCVETGHTSDRGVSELLKNGLKGLVVCHGNTWYTFDKEEGVWKENDSSCVRPLLDEVGDIAEELLQHYTNKLVEMIRKYGKESDEVEEEKPMLKFLMGNAVDLISKASDQPKKVNVLKALQEIIVDRLLPTRWNRNRTNFHCKNGVVDLLTGEFRQSRPDDYATLSCGLDYKPLAEHAPEDVAVVEQFFRDITCDREDLYKFLLTFLSSILDGRNKDQYFMFLLGAGANGKSALFDLLSRTLGGYYTVVDPQLLFASGHDASKPNEALAALLGVRLALCAETPNGVMTTRLVKSIVGGDMQTFRFIYGKQMKARFSSKLLISTNDLPQPDDNTWGFWRKVLVMMFDAHFVEKPVAKNEKLLDTEFVTKVYACADTFLALLVDYNQKYYMTEGVGRAYQPAAVTQARDRWRQNQDPVQAFIEKATKPNAKSFEATEVVRNTFLEFCRTKKFKIDDKKALLSLFMALDARYPKKGQQKKGRDQKKIEGKPKHGWNGIELLTNEEDWKMDWEDDAEETAEEEDVVDDYDVDDTVESPELAGSASEEKDSIVEVGTSVGIEERKVKYYQDPFPKMWFESDDDEIPLPDQDETQVLVELPEEVLLEADRELRRIMREGA